MCGGFMVMLSFYCTNENNAGKLQDDTPPNSPYAHFHSHWVTSQTHNQESKVTLLLGSLIYVGVLLLENINS